MKRTLDPRAALLWLGDRLRAPAYSAGGAVLTGALGTRALRARRFDCGLAVGMALTRPLRRAADACLLLAATAEACDDALYVADGQLWLLRHYPPALREVELDLLIKQQQTLAALLDADPRGMAPSAPAPATYA